jgi:hypothetical protein
MFRDFLEKRHKTIKENCRSKKENHKQTRKQIWDMGNGKMDKNT